MRKLSNLIRRLAGRREKKRHPFRWVSLLLIGPLCALLTTVIAFFVFDDFNYYVISSWNHATNQNKASYPDYSGFENWDMEPTAPDTGSDGSSDVPGSVGLYNMYIYKMSGGYYREMLEIMRDHCTWDKMNSNVKPVERNGEQIFPSISTIIGLSLNEGALENEGGARVSPVTVMSRNAYDAGDGKHTLSLYNSTVAREDNGDSLSSGYNKSLDLSYHGSTTYRTHMQFSAGFAAIYPSGRYADEGKYYPSKMNGYGISSTAERTRADTDAAYFPDDVSIALQRAWCQLDRSPRLFSVNTLDMSSCDIAMYASYNYGEGGMAYLWGVGAKAGQGAYTADKWNAKNTMSFADNTSASLNYIGGMAEKIVRALASDYEGYTKGVWDGGYYPYANHEDYKGLAFTSLLLNGCFVSPENEADLRSHFNNDAYIRGATIAYRVFKNDKSITMSQVREWVKNFKVQSVDKTKYPNFCDSLIHYVDTTCKIYKDNGEGPYSALRSYSGDVAGVFFVHIGGPIVYWNMLKASGVECTFGDAFNDVGGTMVGQMTPAQLLARCAVSYAYPNEVLGHHNNGTELYQKVLQAVNKGDPYYQSCDRGVATAVRWAGLDDNFPMGSTQNQLRYFDGGGNGHWTKVDWGGDQSKLQVGDILIRNDIVRNYVPPTGKQRGHIVLFVGHDIIAKYHPDAPSSYLFVSASYEFRSPGCGAWKAEYSTYECYRNIQPETESRYTNLVPYVWG